MTFVQERSPGTQAPSATGVPRPQKVGGAAALYLALALLAAMPYFLLLVDYPDATTAEDKVALVVDNYASMYAVYIATYVLFGMAVAMLALALHDRLAGLAPSPVRFATAVGLVWSVALVLSGMVFTYGMTAITDLHETGEAEAVQTWQAIEPVAMALGGAGGELLGGLWVLLLSVVTLRTRAFPRMVSLLGLVIGVLGLTSVVPPLHDAGIGFGLLQIVWFLCVAWLLTRTPQRGSLVHRAVLARPSRRGTGDPRPCRAVAPEAGRLGSALAHHHRPAHWGASPGRRRVLRGWRQPGRNGDERLGCARARMVAQSAGQS